jgi:hypothetical protein
VSHFTHIAMEFKDQTSLVEALIEMGFTREQIEVHEKATNLFGYQGDKRTDLANIIIRRKYVGSASNDIGFVKGANGSFTAIISDFDRGSEIGGESRGKYGTAWQNRLKQTYGARHSERLLTSRGYKVTRNKQPNGAIKLVAVRAG